MSKTMNHYMTEEYMTSILQQYKNPSNSPLKTPQNVSQNYTQFNEFYENEESMRSQLNESLFKSIDSSMSSQTNKSSNVSKTLNPIHKMSTNPLITSDSFRKAKPILQSKPLIRSTYFGRPLPQSRPKRTYRAKVIDYSNESFKPPVPLNSRPVSMSSERNLTDQTIEILNALNETINSLREKPSPEGRGVHNSRPLSVSSVLTERNIDPIRPNVQTFEAMNASTNWLRPKPSLEASAAPKSILKNSPFRVPTTKPIFSRVPKTLKPSNVSNFKANTSSSVQTKATQLRDSLVAGYEREGILKTADMDKCETYYCYYCDTYIKKLMTVEKHCKTQSHKQSIARSNANSLHNALNKKFILGQMKVNERMESFGLNAETVFRLELNRIPIENKHYYYSKGIRLRNPGALDVYYCKFCETSVKSLAVIESHISSESHRRSENRPTFMKFVSQTTEPITGLQYIVEYMCPDLTHPAYECTLCKCFEDASDMYSHVCSFGHKINLLKRFNPNEVGLDSIAETPQAMNELKRRLKYIQETAGTGALVKYNTTPKRKLMNKTKEIEVIDLSDDEEVEGMSDVKKHFSLRIDTDEDAADASIVINSLKESVVKYYLSKIPIHMRRALVDNVLKEEVFNK